MSGRIAIMVDDVIDDVQSFVDAATGEFKKKAGNSKFVNRIFTYYSP